MRCSAFCPGHSQESKRRAPHCCTAVPLYLHPRVRPTNQRDSIKREESRSTIGNSTPWSYPWVTAGNAVAVACLATVHLHPRQPFVTALARTTIDSPLSPPIPLWRAKGMVWSCSPAPAHVNSSAAQCLRAANAKPRQNHCAASRQGIINCNIKRHVRLASTIS